MVNKKLWLRMLVITLVSVIPLSGCGNKNDNEETNEITITGITGLYGRVELFLLSTYEYGIYDPGVAAKGIAEIFTESRTFFLYTNSNPFTETGSYLIILYPYDAPSDDNLPYLYTAGQDLSSLDIESPSPNEIVVYSKLPKYELSSRTSTINFDLFRQAPPLVQSTP
jgi:hypothetical protein